MEAAEKIAVTEEAVSRLKKLITPGDNLEGGLLPSEDDLAEKLNVGVSTIREALLVLQALGYVEIRRGRGVFAVEKREDVSENAAVWFSEHVVQMSDYMETRQIIETAAVKLAVQRATEDEIDHIADIHRAMEKAVKQDDVVAMVEADKAFHHAIIKSAHNKVLTILNHRLEKAFEKYRIEGFAMKESRQSTLTPHRSILEALRSRDVGKAQAEIRSHLDIRYKDPLVRSG